jgi:hypothetical protein
MKQLQTLLLLPQTLTANPLQEAAQAPIQAPALQALAELQQADLRGWAGLPGSRLCVLTEGFCHAVLLERSF